MDTERKKSVSDRGLGNAQIYEINIKTAAIEIDWVS